MDSRFFEQPILNSPDAYPAQHWELDADGQPTQRIVDARRAVSFVTPIPKPKKRPAGPQQQMVFADAAGRYSCVWVKERNAPRTISSSNRCGGSNRVTRAVSCWRRRSGPPPR